jgi:hypothetical protein
MQEGTYMSYEPERQFSPAGWLSQTFLAYIAPAIGLVVILSGLAGATDTAGWNAVPYFAIPLLAAALATGVSAVFPSSTIEGELVWALPAVIELCIFVWALCYEPSKVLQVFYVGPHEGEAGWVLGLFTIPTWGCGWYSATMYWRRKRRLGGSISGGGNSLTDGT